MNLIDQRNRTPLPTSFERNNTLNVTSYGVSHESKQIFSALEALNDQNVRGYCQKIPKRDQSLSDTLFDSLATFKIYTSQVAMYLDRSERDGLFRQLDSLLDRDEWDPEDLPPRLTTFRTFMRMVLALKFARRPGLGVTSDGMIVASWTAPDARLTIECLLDDGVKYVLSLTRAGRKERSAGSTIVGRLSAILAPFDLGSLFNNANKIPG